MSEQKNISKQIILKLIVAQKAACLAINVMSKVRKFILMKNANKICFDSVKYKFHIDTKIGE